jgi:membrane-associated protein
VLSSALVHPLLLGIPWMDPNWILAHFHTQFVWVSLAIIFVECGLFFPFLPGDTMLFAIGLFVATDKLNFLHAADLVELLGMLVMFTVAAFAGNVVGYEIGRKIGPPIREHDGRIVKKKYIERTQEFFDDRGSVALVIGRFVPFVRTYVTVIAGVTEMPRHKFWLWSAVGAAAWVLLITCLGYFLGSAFPSLGKNIDVIILALLAFSVLPIGYEWWKQRGQEA